MLSAFEQQRPWEVPLRHAEALSPSAFPLYTAKDTHGSAKGLEEKLLGEAPKAAQLGEAGYARSLAQALKSLPSHPELGEKPGAKDFLKFLTRRRIEEVVELPGGEKIMQEQLTPRQLQIQGWFRLGLSQLRKELREPQRFRDELQALKQPNDSPPTAFAWQLKERFERLAQLRSDPKRQFVRALGRLAEMSPKEYENTPLASKIDQDRLARLYCAAFGLEQIPEGRLEGLACQPHLNAERWAEALAILEEALANAPGLHSALGRFCEGLFLPEEGGLRLNLYSAADTLLDYAGGVDAVVEVIDADGRVRERLLIDITTNTQALGAKVARARRGESLANHIFLFERSGILPTDGDPSLPQVLSEENFRILLGALSASQRRGRSAGQ